MTPAAGTALAALATLDTKGRGPMTGYPREKFGDWGAGGCESHFPSADER